MTSSFFGEYDVHYNILKCIILVYTCTINCKINGTPQRCLLAHSAATLYFSHSEFILTHNNITISYYVQVNLLLLKSNVASK